MAQWLLHFQSIQVSSQLTVISNFTLEPDTYTRVWHTHGDTYTHVRHTHGDTHVRRPTET